MIEFIKRLLGGGAKQIIASEPPPSLIPTPPPKRTLPALPPLPADKLAEFCEWFVAQGKPAVALVPDPAGTIGAAGSRLGGPAWLAEGEVWPRDARGVPLEFLAQLDMADCQPLDGYPADGIIQFFIGRDNLFGANFDDLLAGGFLVRWISRKSGGILHPQPDLFDEQYDARYSGCSPFEDLNARSNGLALRPEQFVDRMDVSIGEASRRYWALCTEYHAIGLEDFVDSEEQQRALVHHTGGYPAFTQNDIREQREWSEYDHVLLRLTSDRDDVLMWGDSGEAVFMIRSADLAKRDLSRVIYSWDCY